MVPTATAIYVSIIIIRKGFENTKLNKNFLKFLSKVGILTYNPYIYNRIKYKIMKKLTTQKTKDGRLFFVDGEQVTQYQWQTVYAHNHGYKNFYQFSKDHGYTAKQLKAPEQTFRIKEEFTTEPEGIFPIPGMENYFATREGQIWCWSIKRNRWINIAQQMQKSGYRVFQPYINGVRRVKYAHIAIHNACNGQCGEGEEVHHIDNDNRNNHADNLMCMPKDEHRRMTRRSYKPRLVR